MKLTQTLSLSLKKIRDKKFCDLSEKFLTIGHFIQQHDEGRYFFLPLGIRVINNISNLLRYHLNKLGAQETSIPLFHSMKLREESQRGMFGDVFVKNIKDREGNVYNLAASPEEMYLDLLRKYLINEEDLPLILYQFGKKFRDEDHTRYLLRLKEFTMMDAYSFHESEINFKEEYLKMCTLFSNFFREVNLTIQKINSFNGLSIGAFAHEFVVNSDAGESNYLSTKNDKYIAHTDIASFQKDFVNQNEKPLEIKIVNIPTKVRSIQEYTNYFSVPQSKIIKSKAYKNLSTGQIYIAIIRGDLDFNDNKIEIAIGQGCQITPANNDDLSVVGLQLKNIPAWGCKKVIYIGDNSLLTVRNLIGGNRVNNTDAINVNYGRDFKCTILIDIATAKEGYLSLDGYKLKQKIGIELGNTYQFGYFITSKMKHTTFTDKNKKIKPIYMGAYSIGIERLMATIVEKNHDKNGIIWPISITPYDVYLISGPHKDVKNNQIAEKIYAELEEKISVLFDDRETVSSANKYKNALLIGLPFIVIIDKEALSSGKYKLVERKSLRESRLSLKEIVKYILLKNRPTKHEKI